jgi:hypothetical protein
MPKPRKGRREGKIKVSGERRQVRGEEEERNQKAGHGPVPVQYPVKSKER